MNKQEMEETIEVLENWKREKEIEDGAKKLFTKWMVIICRTSTIAIMAIGGFIGSWIGEHSDRAVKAMYIILGLEDHK